jgi:hypothetical protein
LSTAAEAAPIEALGRRLAIDVFERDYPLEALEGD